MERVYKETKPPYQRASRDGNQADINMDLTERLSKNYSQGTAKPIIAKDIMTFVLEDNVQFYSTTQLTGWRSAGYSERCLI
jgi:hypothetical protein